MSQWTEIAHKVLDALKDHRHELSSAIREDKYPERLSFLRGRLRVIEQTRDNLLSWLAESRVHPSNIVHSLEDRALLGRDEAKQRLADKTMSGGLVDYERGIVHGHVFVLDALTSARIQTSIEQETSSEQ